MNPPMMSLADWFHNLLCVSVQAGCCEALSILSMQYSPVVYTMAWHSHLSRPPEEPTALYRYDVHPELGYARMIFLVI